MNNLRNKKTFIKNYFKTIKNVTDNIDENQLQLIINILIQKIKNRNNIFVAGNGGSSSVANHLFCDFNKGIKISSKSKMIPKVISLSNSIEIITAISNDINYDKIFSFQLENYYKKNHI
jgi:phosphoheptose isomerase